MLCLITRCGHHGAMLLAFFILVVCCQVAFFYSASSTPTTMSSSVLEHWLWGCPSSSSSSFSTTNDVPPLAPQPPPPRSKVSLRRPQQQQSREKKTEKKPGDICFVTCIFGDSVDEVDHPGSVEFHSRHWCQARFLLVTNLQNLPAPGWQRVVVASTGSSSPAKAGAMKSESNTHKNIVQSREAKFLAWKVLPVQDCAVVIYMDGYLTPKTSLLDFGLLPQKFQHVIEQVQSHPYGLSQVKQKYFNGLTMPTILNNLIRDGKDSVEHVNATLQWMLAQSDYQPVMTYYLNKYFAYDPNNANYQKLSSWFWEKYTTYGGLWRDQPLWAYTLHHFNCTPAVMTTRGTITKGGDLFHTGGTLGWDQHVYVPRKE